MTLRERLREILDERGPMTVSQLSAMVDRSEAQVRIILNEDARKGRVVKVIREDEPIVYRVATWSEQTVRRLQRAKDAAPVYKPTGPRRWCDV